MNEKGPIAADWQAADGERTTSLNRDRVCASLTVPSILPREGQTDSEWLTENYQSMGSMGVTNMTGRLLTALFDPIGPWFVLRAKASIRNDPNATSEEVERADRLLFAESVIAHSILESPPSSNIRGYSANGLFRSQKRISIQQLLVTGDTLEMLTDDYRLKVFRRTQYVTERDSCGDAMLHIIKEKMDALRLTEEQRAVAGISTAEIKEKRLKDRQVDLYTRVEWNPLVNKWVITQECNGRSFTPSEERYTPYFSTAYDLVPGENYGRSYVESIKGDLFTLDSFEESRINLIGLMSKGLIGIDEGSNVRDEDVAKAPGSPVRCRVMGGKVQDIGMIAFDNMREVAMLTEAIRDKRADIGRAMLLGGDSVRNSERTTAYEVQRVTIQQLEGSLGGLFAPISGQQQRPCADRVIYQCRRDKYLKPLPESMVDVELTTGIAALSRAAKAQELLELAQVVSAFGPQAQAKINQDVLVDLIARYRNINEPGLIKSNEQVQQEMQQALALQMQQSAGEQAIATAGSIAEQQATQGNQQ